jgi:hypothetical protein
METGESVKNTRRKLRAWIDLLDARHYSAGTDWYKEAREFVARCAARYCRTPETVAALVAVLSPATAWEVNKRQAEALLRAYADGLDPKDVTLSTYGTQAAKALAILTNGTATEEDLGPTAWKTRAFYNNLIGSVCHVTIDRWILRALGLENVKVHTERRHVYDAFDKPDSTLYTSRADSSY